MLRDTGLTAADVDGIVGSTPPAAVVQSALGIPEITWFANPQIPFVNQLVAAVGAVYSGQCDVVLGVPRALTACPMFSRSAAQRPVPAQRWIRGRVRARASPETDRRRGRLHRVGVALSPRVRRRT